MSDGPVTEDGKADERFCPRCGVVWELHPEPDDPEPDPHDCAFAESKADLLRAMDCTFGLV